MALKRCTLKQAQLPVSWGPFSSRTPAAPRHKCIAARAQSSEARRTTLQSSRRDVLQILSFSLPALDRPSTAVAEEQQAAGQVEPPAATPEVQTLQPFGNAQQQYRLSIPSSWEKKDKAGADVLFEDPSRRSTSVGVTVSPVRVASIEKFGDLQVVGQRLLNAEQNKESTLDVSLIASSSRRGAAGATMYNYEYQLDSTRGMKRIFNTVTITGSKLYILNGNYKCDKEVGCDAPDAARSIGLLRQVAASFDAGKGL